jgi:hypothetical protein
LNRHAALRVLVNYQPVKNAVDDSLISRGGAAFLAELM